MAEDADGAAYTDAVPGYAALGWEELREAARAVAVGLAQADGGDGRGRVSLPEPPVPW